MDPPAPNITAPSALFQRVSPSTYGADSYLLSLAADSAFEIVFPGGATVWAWSGRYDRADSVLVFHFNDRSPVEMSARGTLRGDTLVLQYNSNMQMTDFENGVYVRNPQGP